MATVTVDAVAGDTLLLAEERVVVDAVATDLLALCEDHLVAGGVAVDAITLATDRVVVGWLAVDVIVLDLPPPSEGGSALQGHAGFLAESVQGTRGALPPNLQGS